MTKAEVEARLALLENDKQDAINRALTLDGAIQECKHWLDQVSQETPDATALTAVTS